jgi:hypothetical protein
MAMAGPSISERVERLEEKTSAIPSLVEFRQWGIAIIVAVTLAALGGAVTWGRLTAQVDEVAAEVEALRRDLNARAQVGP